MAALRTGPYLFGGYDTSLAVWFMLDGPGTATVRIGALSASKTVDSSTNYCGHVLVTGLTPATEYVYTLAVDGVDASGPNPCQTLPAVGKPGRFNVILGFDGHTGEIADPDDAPAAQVAGFKGVQLLRRPGIPLLWVSGGDIETPGLNPDDIAARRASLTTVRLNATAEKKQLHREVQLCSVWDDHDGGGNNVAGGGQDISFREMLTKVQGEMFSGQPPFEADDGRGTYFHQRVADCLFVFLDDRTYNEPTAGTLPANPSYVVDGVKCWGDKQVAWLKQTLLDNQDCVFKFVINGTTIVDNTNRAFGAGGNSRDSVGIYYRAERNSVHQWLKDNPACARGFIWCTGDDHDRRVYYSRSWHVATSNTSTTPLAVPIEVDLPLLELKGSALATLPGIIGLPFYQHPDAIWGELHGNDPFTVNFPGVILLEIDTSHPAGPRARVALYRFEYEGQFYTGVDLLPHTWPAVAPGDIAKLELDFWITPEEAFVPPPEQLDSWYTSDSFPTSAQAPDAPPPSSPFDPESVAVSPFDAAPDPPAIDYGAEGVYVNAMVDGGFLSAAFSGIADSAFIFWLGVDGVAIPGCLHLQSFKAFATIRQSFFQTVALGLRGPGVPVAVNFQMKFEDQTPTVRFVRVYIDKGNGVLELMASIPPIIGSGWLPYSFPFASLGTVGAVRMELDGPASDGTIDAYLDDLECWVGNQTVYSPDAPPASAWS